MSTIFLTGAAGFIGSHLYRALTARGHKVIGIDDLSGGTISNLPNDATFDVCDCNHHGRVQALMRAYNVDTLVHCAANAREGASQFQPRSVTNKNASAYMTTLSAALESGVKNVVVFSSMAVYGKQEPPFDEALERRPVDVYGCNKSFMEHATEILASVHGFNYVVIRPHNVFGEGQRMADIFRNVAAIMMNRILRDEPLFVYGDGEQTRAFSYIGDSLPCFVAAIEHCAQHSINGNAFNIGGMSHITVNQLAQEILSAMGRGADYPVTYLPDRPLEVKHAYSTYAKSVAVLDYQETIGWREGIQRMAQWAQKQGPQAWVNNEPLEIITEHTPTPWLTK
jgi:UDP-glucose 4-epimerase